jgi:molybdate transport system substrate-binding protein
MSKGILIPSQGVGKTKRFALAILLVAALLAACEPASTPAPVVPTSVPLTATPVPPTATPIPPTATPQPRTLIVFAAASLTDAFTEMGKNFEAANAGVTVTFNFAGSQTLRTQLEQGAAADVFASANATEMNTLVTDTLVAADSSQIFLTNSMLVILPASNPANIQTLQDLTRPGIKLVLCDTTVPCGKYARQILANMDKDTAFSSTFSTQVLANVVSNETDIKQVVAKVQLGEADAGIVYVSDSVAAPDLKTIEFPAAANVIAKYPIAVLKGAAQPDLAASFIGYVLSSDGQAILKKWGFIPVAP